VWPALVCVHRIVNKVAIGISICLRRISRGTFDAMCTCQTEWTRHHHHISLHPLPSIIIPTSRLLKSNRFLRSNAANCQRRRKIKSDKMRAGSWKPWVLVLDCAFLFICILSEGSKLRSMRKSPEDDCHSTEPLPSLSPILSSERLQLPCKSLYAPQLLLLLPTQPVSRTYL
jgi:hypothetical protein